MHLLLDGDGVLWRGGELLPGIESLLEALKQRGIGYSFLSNNSSARRETLAKRFKRLSLPFRSEDIFNTNYASGWYLRRNHKEDSILVIGHEELVEELRSVGVNAFTPEETLPESVGRAPRLSIKSFFSEKLGVTPSVILMGIDTGISYAKLALACVLVQDGVHFIATNRDYSFPAESGHFLPGNGALVEVVEKVCGVTAVCLGKPEPFLVQLIEEERGIARDEMLVVGDRLDTDIALARRLGLRSVLMLTGATSDADVSLAISKGELSQTLVVKDAVELANRLSELESL